ncbi:MAG: YbdD/YjiX family protein [Methylococcaceae bacterium]|nr:MAG: YbdD/YjiX family protein [Methylococcaceae bacterium]
MGQCPMFWLNSFKQAWRWLRRASGDDAYERYLAHWQERHAQQGGRPLSRKAFFRAELDRKWNGVRRCC